MPTLPVDLRNRNRAPCQLVGHEIHEIVLLLIPDRDPSHSSQLDLLGCWARKANHYIPFHVGVSRWGPLFKELVLLPPSFITRHKEDFLLLEISQELLVPIPSVKGQDRMGRKLHGLGRRNVRYVGRCQRSEAGEMSIMIEDQMKLDPALGPVVVGPVKGLRTKSDHRGIQAQKLVFEAKLPPLPPVMKPSCLYLALDPTQEGIKGLLEDLGVSPHVGMGEGAFVGGPLGAQVPDLSLDGP